MTRRLAGISWDHQRAHFKFVHTMCASAGASWKILVDLADAVCPAMPATTKEDAWLDAYLKAEKFKKRMSKADLLLGIDRSGDPECEDWRAKADSALEIFLQDMALRIGIHLSHRALIMRFKTKCELFLADDLRTRMTAKSTKAELYATQTAAQFLFDEGLNPLFNAQIVRLRPDLFDPRLPHALYVEAKQYGTANPKRMIEKATWQVWDTWNELDSGHKVREAFLLVFRRAGPLVTFDEFVHLEGRTLYPVVVDAFRGVDWKSARSTVTATRICMDFLQSSTPSLVGQGASGRDAKSSACGKPTGKPAEQQGHNRRNGQAPGSQGET